MRFLEFVDCLLSRKRSSAHECRPAFEPFPPAFHWHRCCCDQKALDDRGRIVRAIPAWRPRCGGRYSRAGSSMAVSRVRRRRTRAWRWIWTRGRIGFWCRAGERLRASIRLGLWLRERVGGWWWRIGFCKRIKVRRIRPGIGERLGLWIWIGLRERVKLRRLRIGLRRLRLGIWNGIGIGIGLQLWIWIGIR